MKQPKNCYNVVMKDMQSIATVWATTWDITDGALIFRDEGGYSWVAYGPGAWVSVQEVRDESLPIQEAD